MTAISFFLDSVLKQISKERRGKYKLEIIAGLKNYHFSKRGKEETPHPESMSLKKNGRISWNDLNYEKSEDVVRAVITTLLPYYVADTQNKIKKYIIENL